MTDRSLIGVGRDLGALRKGFAPLNERFGGLSPRAEALHPLKDGLLQSGHESHPQLCDITDFLRAAGEAVGAGVRRLENIFSLCVLAYVSATDFLRRAKGFKKVLKHLSDNLEAVSMRTHALLAGIRALVDEEKIRFISGRPRKTFRENPLQMVLNL